MKEKNRSITLRHRLIRDSDRSTHKLYSRLKSFSCWGRKFQRKWIRSDPTSNGWGIRSAKNKTIKSTWHLEATARTWCNVIFYPSCGEPWTLRFTHVVTPDTFIKIHHGYLLGVRHISVASSTHFVYKLSPFKCAANQGSNCEKSIGRVSNTAGTNGLKGGGSQWNEQGNWGVKPPNPRQFQPCCKPSSYLRCRSYYCCGTMVSPARKLLATLIYHIVHSGFYKHI